MRKDEIEIGGIGSNNSFSVKVGDSWSVERGDGGIRR
jgi:hypothetical protein